MTTFQPGDRVHLKDGTDEAVTYEVLTLGGQYKWEIDDGIPPWVHIRGLTEPHNFTQVVQASRLTHAD